MFESFKDMAGRLKCRVHALRRRSGVGVRPANGKSFKPGFKPVKVLSSLMRFLTYPPLVHLQTRRYFAAISIEHGIASSCVARGSRKKVEILKKSTFKGTEDQFPTPEEVASLANLVTENIAKTKLKILLSVPKDWCIIKNTALPVVAADNLSSVLAYEMDNLTPFAADDVYYDYDVIKREGELLHVAVYVVKKKNITPYITALEDNGYKISELTLNSLSLLRLVQWKLDGKPNILVANLMPTKTELLVSSNGTLTMSVNLRPETGLQISSCIEGSGEDYNVVFNVDPSKAEQVHEIPVPQSCRVSDVSDMKFPLKEPLPYDFRVAMGSVVGEISKGRKKIDLLSLGKETKTGIPLFLTVLLVLVIFSIFTVSLYFPMWTDEKALMVLDKQIKVLKPEVERLKGLQAQSRKMASDITALNNYNNKRNLTLDMIKELSNILPLDTWIARLIITDKDITLEGYAANASSLLAIIENSKYFKDVSISSTTFKDQRLNKERFQIKAGFK